MHSDFRFQNLISAKTYGFNIQKTDSLKDSQGSSIICPRWEHVTEQQQNLMLFCL